VTTGRQIADPVFSDGLVFTIGQEIAGDHEQAFVAALDAATGAERWRFPIDPVLESTFGGITVADGTVYVDTIMGALFALDAATGQPRWLSNLTAKEGDYLEHLTAPAVDHGAVYVADGSRLHAVDTTTGKERWRFRPDADHESLRIPTVVDGIVYLPGNHNLYAVDAQSGKELWRFTTEGSLGNDLAVVDGVTYLSTGSSDNPADVAHLYALDAKSGDQLWRFDTEGYVSVPAVVGDVVYVGTGVQRSDGKQEGAVRALAAANGKERWNFPVAGFATAPVVVEGHVYVGAESQSDAGGNLILYAIGGTPATTDAAHQ
jgi:serine/threonine-protein kinase